MIRAARKRPLVLVHGFTGHPESWLATRQALRWEGELLPFTLLGHAGSAAAPSPFAAETRRLLDEAQTVATRERPLLAAYSMGARLALSAVVKAPELFAGALLIGSSFGLQNAALREERRREEARWIDLLERGGIEAFVSAWEAHPTLRLHQASEAARQAQRLRRLAHHPLGLATALRCLGLGEMPDCRPALPALKLPLFFMAGAHDAKFRSFADEGSRLAPEGRFLLSRGGHDALLESPSEVAAAIDALDERTREIPG